MKKILFALGFMILSATTATETTDRAARPLAPTETAGLQSTGFYVSDALTAKALKVSEVNEGEKVEITVDSLRIVISAKLARSILNAKPGTEIQPEDGDIECYDSANPEARLNALEKNISFTVKGNRILSGTYVKINGVLPVTIKAQILTYVGYRSAPLLYTWNIEQFGEYTGYLSTDNFAGKEYISINFTPTVFDRLLSGQNRIQVSGVIYSYNGNPCNFNIDIPFIKKSNGVYKIYGRFNYISDERSTIIWYTKEDNLLKPI